MECLFKQEGIRTNVENTLSGCLSLLLILFVIEEVTDCPELSVLLAVLVVLLKRLVLTDHLDLLLHVHDELRVDGVLGVDKAVGTQLPVHLLEVRKQLLLVDALSRRKHDPKSGHLDVRRHLVYIVHAVVVV